MLQGIPGVVLYIDNILITGKNEGEHMSNLKELLNWLRQSGLRLKLAKCNFMVSSVDYLGYLIDKDGLHPLPEKVAAILEAPQPKNVQG